MSVLMIGGHFILFAFLSTFLGDVAGLSRLHALGVFTVLGIAGVTGGHLGGWLADRLRPRLTIVLVPSAYVVALAMVAVSVSVPWLMFTAMAIWARISWMISPVVQSFLISTSPETSGAGLGLNFSAMHVGVALGSGVGGLVLTVATSRALPFLGLALSVLAVSCAILAHRTSSRLTTQSP